MRLPLYSPDFNPIKMAISKVKSVLLKLVRRAIDASLQAIAQGVDSITAEDPMDFIQRGDWPPATSGW